MVPSALLLSLLAAKALAESPPLCASICVDPPGYVFHAEQTASAIQLADHHFRVLILETVGTERGPWRSATEAKLEATWESWTSHAANFNPAEDVLIVLGMDEREVRVRTGARWDADYGLSADALLPLIDLHFIPRAQAGDLDGGLARLVTGVNASINWRIEQHEASEAPAEQPEQVPALHEQQLRFRADLLHLVNPAVGVQSVPPGRSLPQTQARVGELPYLIAVFDHTADGAPTATTTGVRELLDDALYVGRSKLNLYDTTVIFVSLDERQVAFSPARRWGSKLAGLRALGDDVDASVAELVDAMELDYQRVRNLRLDQARQQAVDDAERKRQSALWQLESDRRRAEEHASTIRDLLLLALGFVCLSALVGATLLALKNMSKRAWLLGTLRERREALARARAILADLEPDDTARAQLDALMLTGPTTRALVEGVNHRIATLSAGLDLLEQQHEEVLASAPRFASASVWSHLAIAIDEPLSVEVVAAPDTFADAPSRARRLVPNLFMSEIDSVVRQARADYARLRDAAAASQHRAEADLADTDLQRMHAQLQDAGLPTTWLAPHPLMPSPARTWAHLDAQRVADPVAYLNALDQAIAKDDELEQIVAELVGWRTTSNESWERVRASAITDLHTAFADPHLAPSAHEAPLRSLRDDFEHALAAGDDLTQVRDRGQALAVASAELEQHQARVRQAVLLCTPTLERARDAVERGRTDQRAMRDHLNELLSTFVGTTVDNVRRERDELGVNIAEAEQALARAEVHAQHHQHLEALQAATLALSEITEAEADLAALARLLSEALATRDHAKALWEGLQVERDRRTAELANLKKHGRGFSFEEGDQLFAKLKHHWNDSPANWAKRLVAIQRVRASWSNTVARAAASKQQRAALYRISETERERHDREAQRAFHTPTSSSYGSYDTSSARTSSYSSSSSAGSSYDAGERSAGSSYDAGGRSAGGSYGAGGRSAGRKW